MRKEFVLGFGALLALSSIVVFAAQPEFLRNIVSHVVIGSTPRPIADENATVTNEARASSRPATGAEINSDTNDHSKSEVPETVLWHMVFKMDDVFEKEAQKLSAEQKDGKIWSEYFIRQTHLTPIEAETLRNLSSNYLAEIRPLDEEAKNIIEAIRSKYPGGRINDMSQAPTPPAELKELQDKKDATTLRYRDLLSDAIGLERFQEFNTALQSDFAKGIAPIGGLRDSSTESGGAR